MNFFQKYFFIGTLTFLFFIPTSEVKATFGDTSTFVGTSIGGDGKNREQAYLDQPGDFFVDTSGNFYIADTMNNIVRKISSSGTVSTFAGTGAYGDVTGANLSAKFSGPQAIAWDDSTLFVADTDIGKIKKISSGSVSTLVSSGLSYPRGLYADTANDILYIADTNNNAIKKVGFSGGSVTTLTTSNLNHPTKMVKNGNTLYVLNEGNSKVLAVDVRSGGVSTVASGFLTLGGITYYNGSLYVVDGDGLFDYLQKVDLDGTKTVIAEDGSMITLNTSSAVLSYSGKFYVLNRGSSSIYRFDADGGNPTFFAGKDRFGNDNGTGTSALIGRPKDVVLSHDRQFLFLAENNKIRKITRATGKVESLIGNSVDNYKEGRTGSNGRFSDVPSLVISPDDETLYIVDRNNNRVRGINIATQTDFLISGAGEINSNGSSDNGYQEGKKCLGEFDSSVSGCAYFNRPAGIAIAPDGKFLYVADTGNNRIRRVRVSDGQTSLIAGGGAVGFTNGVGTVAKFNSPYDLDIDPDGEVLYVVDKGNHAIRVIDLATRAVTTLAGTGSAGYNDAAFDRAVFSFPEYVTYGGDGNVYVSEAGSQRIRQLDLGKKVTKLVSGAGTRGFADGAKNVAQWNNPKGLFVDAQDDVLYVTDNFNDRIRKIDIEGEAPFTELAPTVTRADPNTKTPAGGASKTLFLSVYGTNFHYGAKAYFGPFEAVKTYLVSSTALTVQIPFGLMDPGHYDITVKNLDTQQYTLSKGFRVSNNDGTIPDVHYQATGSVSGSNGSSPVRANFFAYDARLQGGFQVASCDLDGDGVDEILTGTGNGMAPHVKGFTQQGKLVLSFFAFPKTQKSGVRISCGNLDKDTKPEIVVSAGPGAKPLIRVFSAGGVVKNNGFYALDGKFLGGTFTAVGDVNGDKKRDIVVSAGKGGGPQVTVHQLNGKSIGNFFAYGKTFRGGIRVATADVDGDGRDEILTGTEFGTSHIQMFGFSKGSIRLMNPGFFAFDKKLTGGVSVAGIDTDGDGKDEIVVGLGSGNTPLVRVYNRNGVTIDRNMQAFATTFRGGVNVTAGDTDGDGDEDVIVIPMSKGIPDLRVLK